MNCELPSENSQLKRSYDVALISYYIKIRCLFLSTLSQDFLDRLLFFQQKGSYNPLSDTGVACRSTVASTNGPFPLGCAMVFTAAQVLDSGKRNLTVTALGTLGDFVQTLRLETTARGTDRAVTV